MPLIRADYNPIVFTGENIREYKGLLRETVAEKLDKRTADVTTLSAPYEHMGDSIFAAEIVAHIGKHIAEVRYPLKKVERERMDIVTGLDVVQDALWVATRDFKAAHAVQEEILLATLPCDWKVGRA